jgi:hypothetical protein
MRALIFLLLTPFAAPFSELAQTERAPTWVASGPTSEFFVYLDGVSSRDESGERIVYAPVEFNAGESAKRLTARVSGCYTVADGVIGYVGQTDLYSWVWNGRTVADSIATNVCAADYKKHEATPPAPNGISL